MKKTFSGYISVMRRKGQVDRSKILRMIPLSLFEMTDEQDYPQGKTFSDDTIIGLVQLGEILKGIAARHRMHGYYIMSKGIYSSNNELIYENNEHSTV